MIVLSRYDIIVPPFHTDYIIFLNKINVYDIILLVINMICKKCGNKLTNDTYCIRCGFENDENKKKVQIDEVCNNVKKSNRGNPQFTAKIIILVFILLLISLFVINNISLFSNNNTINEFIITIIAWIVFISLLMLLPILLILYLYYKYDNSKKK